jgi:hypothetical protein
MHSGRGLERKTHGNPKELQGSNNKIILKIRKAEIREAERN